MTVAKRHPLKIPFDLSCSVVHNFAVSNEVEMPLELQHLFYEVDEFRFSRDVELKKQDEALLPSRKVVTVRVY